MSLSKLKIWENSNTSLVLRWLYRRREFIYNKKKYVLDILEGTDMLARKIPLKK